MKASWLGSGAMSRARLSAPAPEQLQIPELPFKQGTSISHHHSFPGRAAAVYYNPQNVPHPLSLVALQRCWPGNWSGLKWKGRGNWGGCNSREAEGKEMPSPPSLLMARWKRAAPRGNFQMDLAQRISLQMILLLWSAPKVFTPFPRDTSPQSCRNRAVHCTCSKGDTSQSPGTFFISHPK